MLEERDRLRRVAFAGAVQFGHKPRERLVRGPDHSFERRRIKCAVQRTDRLDDGTERQRAVDELEAASGDAEAALTTGARDEFAHEPRLADAGLPADEHRRGALFRRGALEQREQALQLGFPADEPRTGDTRRHARDSGGLGGERAA